jgi:diaminopimelate decarboxylase
MKTDHLPLEVLSDIRTPYYLYDRDLLAATLEASALESRRFGFHVHYAMKANAEKFIVKDIQKAGFGADCVSGNEVKFALDMGFEPEKVVFAGVGKTDTEIREALAHDIFCFNCESAEELRVINELAGSMGKIARVAIRVNPNVDARTHSYITTGLEENKFGIGMASLPEIEEELSRLNHVRFTGLHFHIGSQITDLDVFRGLCLRMNEVRQWFNQRNLRPKIINAGGGLGIDYHHPDSRPIPDFAAYFRVFDKFLERDADQSVHFELGRALVGQCGSLISRVLFVKKGLTKQFIIADAGMNDLMRPALYGAFHKIENLSSLDSPELYDVVGPVCESSDCFGKSMLLNRTKRGDFLAVRSAGAYGAVMSSAYNLRMLPSAFYLSGGRIFDSENQEVSLI